MDLKEYFSIIGKHVWLLIGVTVIIFLGVLWYSYRTPVTYDSSVFVTAAVKNSGLGEKPNYYDYDNYYSLQGSGFFADNIISWLSDPSNVSEIFSRAKITEPNVNLKKMSKVLQTKKKIPNYLKRNI